MEINLILLVPNAMMLGWQYHEPEKGFDFSDQEKTALLQFLNTLTDESFINDPRFESPF